MRAQQFVLLLTAAALSACGLTDEQNEGVRQFSEATQATATSASAELTLAREQMIEMNKELVQLVGLMQSNIGSEQLRHLSSNGGVISVPNLNGDVDPAAIAEATSAVEALDAYASALVALVDGDGDNLAAAASKLSGSLKTLKVKDKRIVSDEKADAIAAIVRQGLGLLADKKRAEALRSIVATYAEPVRAVAPLLASTLDPTSPTGGVAVALKERALTLLLESKKALVAANGYAEREQALRGYSLADRVLRRLDQLTGRMSKTLDAMVAAHTTLESLLERDEVSLDAIRLYFTEVKDLFTHLKILTKE